MITISDLAIHTDILTFEINNYLDILEQIEGEQNVTFVECRIADLMEQRIEKINRLSEMAIEEESTFNLQRTWGRKENNMKDRIINLEIEISGPTGSGKERVLTAIHKSLREDFDIVNIVAFDNDKDLNFKQKIDLTLKKVK